MIKYKVDREKQNDLGKKVYDELLKIKDDEKFIFDTFLLIKQDEAREKLLEYLQNTKDLDDDKVVLKAIQNSQKLALFGYIK